MVYWFAGILVTCMLVKVVHTGQWYTGNLCAGFSIVLAVGMAYWFTDLLVGVVVLYWCKGILVYQVLILRGTRPNTGLLV